MTFSEEYEALEREFCERVQIDFCSGFCSGTFLRNIRPESPVDFVLIAMEPSLGGGKPGEERKTRPGGWEEIKEKESRNFSGSMEDFILHFCLKRYLCKGEGTYYLTDLSKGAMATKDAPSESLLRYERWYPLLKKELRLVEKPRKTRVIAIGNEVARFLKGKNLSERTEKVLHYSPSAAGHREKAIKPWKGRFPEFCQTVSLSDIEETAKNVLEQGEYSEDSIRRTLKRLQKGSGLTESRKKLMFHYKNRFERLRTSCHIVLDLNLDCKDGSGTTIECESSPIVKLACGIKVRVKQSARARAFRGRTGTVLQADVPGKGTQIQVDGIKKWMSHNSLEVVEASQ